MSLKVAKPFRFRHADNSVQMFKVGDEVPVELEDHFFVVHHCENPPSVKHPKGSAAYIREVRQRVVQEMADEAAPDAEDTTEKTGEADETTEDTAEETGEADETTEDESTAQTTGRRGKKRGRY
ncbi:MAG: hypothetical protein PHU06_06080 [Gallionella sp.]|nr:hypothetical protein [Gallionella sp.]MDD4958392.1 hypothetical protein [Gallionella sp.]